ncbi:hypothetical protein [Pedobacter steynii]
MKRLFKVVFFGVCNWYFKYRFRKSIKSVDEKGEVYLVDIDNTLADTWPSLQQYVYRSESHRYESLSIFIGMRKFLLDKTKSKKRIIFISARSYLDYFSTRKWLSANGLNPHCIILVRRAEDKLDYINELLNKGISTIYIDDLSYGHEFGEMKLYEKVISKLKKLPIKYLGVKEIELINSAYETSNKGAKKGITYFKNYSSN